MAVGFLGALVNDKAALEDSAGLIIEHALEDLAGRGVGRQMVDLGGVVAVFGAAHEERAVKRRMRALAFEADIDLVPRQPSTERQVKTFIGGIPGDPDMNRAEVCGVLGFGLDHVISEDCAFADIDFRNRIGEVRTDAHSDMVFDHRCFRALAQDHKVPREIGDWVFGEAADEDHLDRLLDLDAGLDLEDKAGIHHRRIEL